MPSEVREARGRAGDWPTLATLWNTTAIGVFLAPAGAQIKARYGVGDPLAAQLAPDARRDDQQTPDRRAVVGPGGAHAVRGRQDTVVRYMHVVEGS